MSNINFEQKIATLEKLIVTMEQNDLSLDDSMNNFEKGIKIIQECQTILNKAEQKISILQEGSLDKFKTK